VTQLIRADGVALYSQPIPRRVGHVVFSAAKPCAEARGDGVVCHDTLAPSEPEHGAACADALFPVNWAGRIDSGGAVRPRIPRVEAGIEM